MIDLRHLEGKTLWYSGMTLDIASRKERIPESSKHIVVTGLSSLENARYLRCGQITSWLNNHDLDSSGQAQDLAVVDGLIALMLAAAEHGVTRAQVTRIDFRPGRNATSESSAYVHAELYSLQPAVSSIP